MPSWFLPPDFTFTADGPLRLGTVIPHPTRPTLVLATPDDKTSLPVPLPQETILTETNHAHSREATHSTGLKILARFVNLASGSAKVDVSRHRSLHYSAVDHEVCTFAAPLSDAAITAIVALPKVRKHIDSGIFGKRPVYVVSGLRIAVSSFTVMCEADTSVQVQVPAGGPAGAVPVELGGEVSTSVGEAKTDCYDTAPGIVFAYRLHVIRSKGSTHAEAEMFSHRTAFLTGEGDDAELMEVAEVTASVLNDDLEEQVDAREENVDEAPTRG
ncbi:hypothetical protein RB595_003791 [Gaeumannomyces hyphopodioides]